MQQSLPLYGQSAIAGIFAGGYRSEEPVKTPPKPWHEPALPCDAQKSCGKPLARSPRAAFMLRIATNKTFIYVIYC